jgi:dTDP-4-dehydrorhamnose 3,5-epimerase
MIFIETKLKGAYIIEIEKREDMRGFFARAFCQREFKAHGLNPKVAQANVSFNLKKGTLRGMHMQEAPHSEAKLVFCTQGAIFDVIIDLRKDSSTYKRWVGMELTEDNHTALYVPEGFAHGYMSLKDDTTVLYLVSEFYEPEAERGFRYDDPAFAVQWPLEVSNILEKDSLWVLYDKKF